LKTGIFFELVDADRMQGIILPANSKPEGFWLSSILYAIVEGPWQLGVTIRGDTDKDCWNR
jgi:hypothetical protein